MLRWLFLCAMLAPAALHDAGSWRAAAAADEASAVADHAEPMRTLERAARDYRIAVYSAFRTDRERFEEYRIAWDNAYTAWQRAGSRPEEVPKLIEWLTTVTRQVEQRPSRPGLAPTYNGAKAPVIREPKSAVENPRPGRKKLSAALQGSSPFAKSPSDISPVLRDRQSAMPPSWDKEPVAERNPPLRPQASGPALRTARKPDLGFVPDILASRPVRLPKGPIAPNAHPTVPALAPGPAASAEKPSLLAGRAAVHADIEPQPATSARINIIELKARTEGYNLGIAAVRHRLASETEWTGRKLAQVLVELEDLISRREDLALYHPLVEGRGLKPLASSDGLLADLHAHVVAAKKQLASSQELNDEELDFERELLDVVEHRIRILGTDSE